MNAAMKRVAANERKSSPKNTERRSQSMSENEAQTDVTALTVQLLSAYLSNNTIAAGDLAGLIGSTRAALVGQSAPTAPAEPETPIYTPAVSVRKSLASPDHIISLIDGKPYKTLKRHLSTHGLTPEAYRERYKLAATYPMTAPSFTALRREIAEKIGLGNRRASAAAPAAKADGVPPVDGVSEGASPATAPVASGGKSVAANAKAAPAKPVKSAGRKAGRPPKKIDDATSAAVSDQSLAPAKTVKGSATAAPERKPAKKAIAAKPAASADVASEVSANVATPAKAAKRRGKLGLFGKSGEEGKAGAGDAVVPNGGAAANAVADSESVAIGKPAKAKRMARAPKSAAKPADTK
jgi:predicted transcriptional regulator